MAATAVGFALGVALVLAYTVVWRLVEKRLGTLLAGLVAFAVFSAVLRLGVQIKTALIVSAVVHGRGLQSLWPDAVGFLLGVAGSLGIGQRIRRRAES